MSLAPPEARADEVLKNEHQLMLNRLSFELVERQRYRTSLLFSLLSKKEPLYSLDETKKRLIAERDNLLKESREQQAKLDVINSQIERVSKVIYYLSLVFYSQRHHLL